MLKQFWYGAFITQRWTIGVASGEVGEDASWIGRGKLLEPLRGGDFLADPFVVPGTAGKVLLCEWFRAHLGRGVIARVELGGDGRIADLRTIIDWPPYHLSYPHVISYEGKLYCSPESCHSRSVRLFELSADASQVLQFHTAMDEFAAVDPTLFEHEGRWWLMCTSARQGHSNSHLHAFHGPSPLGPWTAHVLNPLMSDMAKARPAGRVFRAGNRLCRPAQDCSVRYGGGLRCFEIEQLTPQDYREREIWNIYPPVGVHGKHGVHTVNSNDGVIVYDAYTERFSPIAWLYRLREHYR